MQVVVECRPDCPNWQVAIERTRSALDRLGCSHVPVERSFRGRDEGGSPTILVDGADLFADASAATASGATCRVYPSGHGLSGAPTVEQITVAIASRMRCDGSEAGGLQ